MKKQTIVLLDNIRSSHNVGSIFRTADGAGVSKLYLAGTTPAPVDRFGRVVNEIKKTSLGASEMMDWESVSDEGAQSKLAHLKAEGNQIVAIEQTEHAVSLYEFTPQPKTCFIFGNEIDGVSRELLEMSDIIVEIPMQGTKESLNVSVTAGIALFHSP